MSIHFAAANDSGQAARTAREQLCAANDNGDGLGEFSLLRAALQHFAEYGLSAAQRARQNAEQAFLAGRNAEYRHWIAICHALDKRMAGAIAS